MDKTHTPGPWKVSRRFDIKQDVGPNVGGRYIGTTSANSPFSSTVEEDEANARLIAAAPELLEALEAVVDAYNEPDKVSMIDSIGKAGDLISKVNGQTTPSFDRTSQKPNTVPRQ